MMKKWGLALMLVAVLGLPALACGFPLPVTISTDETTPETASKIVCAATEAAESCQLRQDAYELMGALQSGSVQNMDVSLFYDAEDDKGEMHFSGYYDFVINPEAAGLGIDVAATIDEGTFTDASGTQDISGAQFVIVGGTGYSKEAGSDTWNQEDLTSDSDTVLGLGMILGLGGMQVNLFSEPSAFTVELMPDVTIDGQAMRVQKLSADLSALMTSTEALGGLMSAGSSASGGALSEEELGMSSEDMAMLAPMLAGFMSNSSFVTIIYIGADDGLIHRVEDNYVFNLDMSALDPETAPINFTYVLSGDITGHNAVASIVAPEGAVETEGGLLGELGGGGLGQSLFGGGQ